MKSHESGSMWVGSFGLCRLHLGSATCFRSPAALYRLYVLLTACIYKHTDSHASVCCGEKNKKTKIWRHVTLTLIICIHMSLVCYVWITHITTQCHAGRSAALPPCFSAKAASFRTHRMLIGLVFSATASRTCPDWLRAGLCADEMQIQSGAGKRLTPRSEMAIHLQRKGHRSSYDESAYLPKQNLKYSQILSLFPPPTSAHFLPLSVWAEVCSAELWRLQNPSQVCLWLLLCMENALNTSERVGDMFARI